MFGVQSVGRQVLKNNTLALAKTGKVCNIPTTITTVGCSGLFIVAVGYHAVIVPILAIGAVLGLYRRT